MTEAAAMTPGTDPLADLPDGLLAVVKRDCPTCELVRPVLARLAAETRLTVVSQDDPAFPEGISGIIDDTALARSHRLKIEIVPTLIRVVEGREADRLFGWHRGDWQDFSGVSGLGADLPEARPGCGARNLEPGIAERLAARYDGAGPELRARRVTLRPEEDAIEACFERGWSDGLPLVPPTEARVQRMLAGTTRSPDQVIGLMPPDLGECTVEKVAINAVMAGCKPEYLPVALAAVEAALMEEFCMHGLLCTTMFSGPVAIVNGPIARAIGMNSGINALGQGNRANLTIGRALQLVIRNVGGGRPGEVDRAALGNPGKLSFCFAEDESDPDWQPLAEERGIAPGRSAVTLLTGDGVQGVVDQKSREPDSLARSFAACLRAIDHPKLVGTADALLVLAPEHARVFHEAGWSKARLKDELATLLQFPGAELVAGADGIAEGIPAGFADKTLSKFRPDGLNIVRAGGQAGMFSAIIAGWAASGERGSIPVTKEIEP